MIITRTDSTHATQVLLHRSFIAHLNATTPIRQNAAASKERLSIRKTYFFIGKRKTNTNNKAINNIIIVLFNMSLLNLEDNFITKKHIICATKRHGKNHVAPTPESENKSIRVY